MVAVDYVVISDVCLIIVAVGGTGCTYVWKAVAHRHVSGGLRHSATTIAECQAACINDTSCVGVDFNNNRQCYIIRAGVPGQGLPVIIGEDDGKHEEEEKGCVHFNLKRTCGAGELFSLLLNARCAYLLRYLLSRVLFLRKVSHFHDVFEALKCKTVD